MKSIHLINIFLQIAHFRFFDWFYEYFIVLFNYIIYLLKSLCCKTYQMFLEQWSMRGIRSVSNWFDTTKRTENGGNDDSLYILEIYDIIFHCMQCFTVYYSQLDVNVNQTRKKKYLKSLRWKSTRNKKKSLVFSEIIRFNFLLASER